MSTFKLACCYHPTTVYSVDDNQKFFNIIQLTVDRRKAVCQFANDPKKALEYLKSHYSANPFTLRCIRGREDQAPDKRNIEVDIQAIRDEINNEKRFEQISVIVVDFAMPGLNGGELAKQLKGLPFKIILLTGEADAQVAIELFNEGVIHSYIRKDDPHFETLLNSAIHNLQQAYFQDLSKLVLNTVAQTPDLTRAWFSDPAFKVFFDKLCQDNDITEYYLLDDLGSFLLLDAQGKPSWLAVANEEWMETYAMLADNDKAPETITNSLTAKKVLPFFFSAEDFNVRPAQWQPYLHPIQILQGKEIYYYAYITEPKIYKMNNIVSYEQFLDKQI